MAPSTAVKYTWFRAEMRTTFWPLRAPKGAALGVLSNTRWYAMPFFEPQSGEAATIVPKPLDNKGSTYQIIMFCSCVLVPHIAKGGP